MKDDANIDFRFRRAQKLFLIKNKYLVKRLFVPLENQYANGSEQNPQIEVK